jgi:hypothetical protein
MLGIVKKNWRDIDNYLKQNFTHEKTGDVSRGFMDIYSFQGINFASVLFDTGPEIIFDLSSFTLDSEFNEQIINFIRVILSTLENNNCKAISHELRAITTGEKEKFEKTIIQISEYPILNVESTITDIEELINKTWFHTPYKKLTRKW